MTRSSGTFVQEMDAHLDRLFAGKRLLGVTTQKGEVWHICVIDIVSLLCREVPLDEATLQNRRLSPAVREGIRVFVAALPELRLADAALQAAEPPRPARRRKEAHRGVAISVIHRRPR